MASEVEIYNMALSEIRAGSINSFTESSLQAQQGKLKYSFLRDMLLSNTPWGFAHKVDVLAVLTDDLFNWVYAYQYPSDCLHINRLILNYEEVTSETGALRTRHIEDVYAPDLDRQVKYELQNVDGNRVIAANETELRISYRKKITDPNLFSPLFIQAFVQLLAANVAVSIVGAEVGRQLKSDALTLYKSYIEEAAAEANNQNYSEPKDSEFINAYK